MRSWTSFAAALAATLFAAVSSSQALAQDGKTVTLKPGLWRVTSQLWLDGKELLGAIDAAGALASARILEDTRARMSPAERAEFDRGYQPPPRESAQLEMECITPAEASMSPEAALRTALDALQPPPPLGLQHHQRPQQRHGPLVRLPLPHAGQCAGRRQGPLRSDH